jgi:hypothetical protein
MTFGTHVDRLRARVLSCRFEADSNASIQLNRCMSPHFGRMP